MQFGQDDLDPALTVFRVNIDRHTTTIVFHRQRTIFINGDSNFVGMTSQCLIDCIINNLLRQMVWACGIGIHAGTTTYRI
jgi:hypothetical protein